MCVFEQNDYLPGCSKYPFDPVGYVIDHDLYCADCIEGYLFDFPDIFDNPVFPNHAADAPTACPECGELIEQELTPDGYKYIVEQVVDFAVDGTGNPEYIQQVLDVYDDLDDHILEYIKARLSKRLNHPVANKIARIFDSGGKTIDRYTVLLKSDRPGDYLALSDNPDHPQGFSQFGHGLIGKSERDELGDHIKFKDLPGNVQKHIIRRLS